MSTGSEMVAPVAETAPGLTPPQPHSGRKPRIGDVIVNLGSYTVDMGAANLIDMAAAKRFRSVPIAFLDQDRLLVATADPANVIAVDDIAMSTGYEVRMAVSSPE